MRKVERQRAVAVAVATARHDLWQNLQWLGYVDWQRKHPEKAPRFHEFGSFGLFPQYAPVLIAERPELAQQLLFLNAWVEYAQRGPIPGPLFGEDVFEMRALAHALNDGFDFGWDNDVLDRWGSRDYSIPRALSAGRLRGRLAWWWQLIADPDDTRQPCWPERRQALAHMEGVLDRLASCGEHLTCRRESRPLVADRNRLGRAGDLIEEAKRAAPLPVSMKSR